MTELVIVSTIYLNLEKIPNAKFNLQSSFIKKFLKSHDEYNEWEAYEKQNTYSYYGII